MIEFIEALATFFVCGVGLYLMASLVFFLRSVPKYLAEICDELMILNHRKGMRK